MQAESPLTSVSFMHDGAAFAVGTTRGKISVFESIVGKFALVFFFNQGLIQPVFWFSRTTHFGV